MKVLFLQDDVFRSQGVMMLSAMLKKEGHSCDVMVDVFHKDILKEIMVQNPDALCFSLTTTKYLWFAELAKRIKEKTKKPIIVGGAHPTFFPEIIKESFIDYVCIGEGEHAIVELIGCLEKGNGTGRIRNIWSKKGGKVIRNPVRELIRNLDELPKPDSRIYDKYRYFKNLNVFPVIASRGCPYSCTFCFNKRYNELYMGKGPIMRRKSVGNIISEIKETIASNKKITHIVFEDDSFAIAPKDWLNQFFREYKKRIGISYGVNMRANNADEWLIRNLKESGCRSIRMGLESADFHIREEVLRKGISNEQVENAVRLMKKYRIKTLLYHILGVPGETTEIALDTYEFSKNLHPTYCWCSLLHPFPGTDIMDLVLKEKLITNEEIDRFGKSFFLELPLRLPNKKELTNLQKLFQFGNFFRLPKNAMRFLIRLPNNFIYNLVFMAGYGLAIKKMDNYTFANMLKTGYWAIRAF